MKFIFHKILNIKKVYFYVFTIKLIYYLRFCRLPIIGWLQSYLCN